MLAIAENKLDGHAENINVQLSNCLARSLRQLTCVSVIKRSCAGADVFAKTAVLWQVSLVLFLPLFHVRLSVKN